MSWRLCPYRLPTPSHWEVARTSREWCMSPYHWWQGTNSTMLMCIMITFSHHSDIISLKHKCQHCDQLSCNTKITRGKYQAIVVKIELLSVKHRYNIVINSVAIPKSQEANIRLSSSESRANMPIYFGSLSPTTSGCASTGSGSHRDLGSLSLLIYLVGHHEGVWLRHIGTTRVSASISDWGPIVRSREVSNRRDWVLKFSHGLRDLTGIFKYPVYQTDD